ncbi:MAG: hypothetical protein ACC660_07015 [Acidimicrobiales bacterium]
METFVSQFDALRWLFTPYGLAALTAILALLPSGLPRETGSSR